MFTGVRPKDENTEEQTDSDITQKVIMVDIEDNDGVLAA